MNTDGFAALYEIMEHINLTLNLDTKLPVPLPINCSNIHDYSNQLDLFFLYNSVENIHFTPCQQIYKFLEGLDSSYAIATRQIHQKLQAWQETDTNIPPALCLNALLRTIETIMQEDMDIAILCIMHKPTSQSMKLWRDPTHTPHLLTSKDIISYTYVDIQCANCKTYGHKPINFEKMAQFLLLQEASQKINDKIGSKLLENYAKVTQEHCDHQMKCMKGFMRQLY